ncbi:MAG: hypothetical protein OHK0029_41190 [Armatimonadaceae bacterium]
MSLDLKPEMEQRIQVSASQQGLSVEDLIHRSLKTYAALHPRPVLSEDRVLQFLQNQGRGVLYLDLALLAPGSFDVRRATPPANWRTSCGGGRLISRPFVPLAHGSAFFKVRCPEGNGYLGHSLTVIAIGFLQQATKEP